MLTLCPADENYLQTLDLLLKLVAALGALVAFSFGLSRYMKDQAWRRHEFVANEIKDFTSDKIAKNAMFMLDWGERYIELFPDKDHYDNRFVKVDRLILKTALQHDRLRKTEKGKIRFSREEVAIRDTFDHFLSYFERYYQFVEAGLVSETELKPYLNYWVEAITDKIELDVRNVIYHYINEYGFSDTQKLFKRLGSNIHPTTPIETTLR